MGASLRHRIEALDVALRPIANRPTSPADLEHGTNPLDEAAVRAEAEAVLTETLRAYDEGDDGAREDLRRIFAANPSFAWAAALPFPPTTREGFRAHLLLFGINDQGRDTRDAILLIGAIVEQAVAAGLETSSVLREIAAMSGDVDRYGWGSTRDLLLRSAR